jgi:hypothetical protein
LTSRMPTKVGTIRSTRRTIYAPVELKASPHP